MATKIGTISIDSFNATGIEFQTNIFKSDLIAIFQCHKGLASLKCHRLARCSDNANDVLMNRQAWIDITDRKYRPIGIPIIAKIKISTKR